MIKIFQVNDITDMPTYKNFSAEKSDDYHAKKLAFARRVIGL